jgi:hypothetical protein
LIKGAPAGIYKPKIDTIKRPVYRNVVAMKNKTSKSSLWAEHLGESIKTEPEDLS